MNLSLRWMLVPGLLLAGCSTKSVCLREQNYERAKSIAPIEAGDGLNLPQSSTALRIPPPPPGDVPFGLLIKNARGDSQIQCLDRPPPLPAIVQAAPAGS